MGSIKNAVINGKIIRNITGSVITFERGKMYVDGKLLEDFEQSDEKVFNITINGSVEKVTIDVCSSLTVKGNAGKVKTGSGSITVGGDVMGDVSTGSGRVECGNVAGDVSTGSGNVYRR